MSLVLSRISWALAVIGLFNFTGGTASAENSYETTPLFSKGAWVVELTHNTTEGNLWCSAETQNRQGQTLNLTAYDSGGFVLFVFDRRWNIPERPIRFLVDIDYSRWTMDGTGSNISVSVRIDSQENEKAVRFLGELMSGNAVAVMNSDGRRLATFSLSGSYAAVTKLANCWSRIRSAGQTSPSDPFTGTSDPF